LRIRKARWPFAPGVRAHQGLLVRRQEPAQARHRARKRERERERYRARKRARARARFLAAGPAMKLALLEELLARGHSATLRVSGGSMWPALRDGDVVTLAPATTFHPGDLAAALAGNDLVIHRVISSRGSCFE